MLIPETAKYYEQNKTSWISIYISISLSPSRGCTCGLSWFLYGSDCGCPKIFYVSRFACYVKKNRSVWVIDDVVALGTPASIQK
jgi:hypothetical protein